MIRGRALEKEVGEAHAHGVNIYEEAGVSNGRRRDIVHAQTARANELDDLQRFHARHPFHRTVSSRPLAAYPHALVLAPHVTSRRSDRGTLEALHLVGSASWAERAAGVTLMSMP